MNSQDIVTYLENLSDSRIAAHSQRYFKSGKGEYGYGDQFLGIRVPVIRKAVKQFHVAPLSVVRELIRSEFHEVRLFALLLLVQQFPKSDSIKKEQIYTLYYKYKKYINHWDLVDSSAPYIVGAWLLDKDRSILYELAQSDRLWDRRIGIISTGWFIKNGQFNDTLKIASLLINDPEDLIHKAVGWMLREVGKRDLKTEEQYLKQHYKKMPRTMLRYAIEKFEQRRWLMYLKGEV